MGRYSIMPARFFDDDRPKPSHYKVMGYLGKHSDKTGWMKLSQTKAAAEDGIGMARETICRAIADLVEWGYVEKRSKTQTKRSICFYRIIMDAVEDPTDDVEEINPQAVGKSGGCDVAITRGCDAVDHRVVTQEVTTVVTSEVTIKNDPSLKINNTKISARGARSEVSKSDLGSEGPKRPPNRPMFTIQPADTSWRSWIDHLLARGRDDIAADAEASRALMTTSRWPTADSPLPIAGKFNTLSQTSKRMSGEAA